MRMDFNLSVFHVLLAAACVYSCQYDEVVEKTINIPKVFVNYRHSRSKRDINHYSPMRFHVQISEIEKFDAGKVASALRSATSIVSHLFHVIPVHGPLLLERNSCGSTWTHGPNKGRCSSLRSKYRGEFCENKIDNFKIPDEHLDKLRVYNYDDDVPIHTLPAGTGAPAADYILYVTSHLSSWCLQQDIKAYSSYCRLDQHGRPIAGFINFCPKTVDQLFNQAENFEKIALHEIFHVLGFSKDLFPLYSGCPIDDPDCTRPKYIVHNDDYGVPRLTFPSVINQARSHFGCGKLDFGAPLEMVNGSYASHWDPLLMYGSIMSPSFHEASFALIDPITLALLSDSGWYYVNFVYSQTYTWGKDEGCEFGLAGQCDSKEELCKIDDSSTANYSDVGCDFLHFTQTVCQKLKPNHHCGIYKPDGKNDCRKQDLRFEGKRIKDLRCFVTHNQNEINTMCTAYACKTNGELSVIIDDMWITCPYNSVVNVKGKTLFCPKAGVFCYNVESQSDASSADKSSSSITLIITFSAFAGIWITLCGMVLGVSLFHFFGKTRSL